MIYRGFTKVLINLHETLQGMTGTPRKPTEKAFEDAYLNFHHTPYTVRTHLDACNGQNVSSGPMLTNFLRRLTSPETSSI